MSRDDATLLDLVQSARRVLEFKGDLDETAFNEDRKTQAAILHELMIIGEAVRRLSTEFKNQRPEVPWKKIAGMRDKLIHQYDHVDLEEVWSTISSDVPNLLFHLSPRATGPDKDKP